MRRRINATKWPERETVTDASQGVQLATMQELARYWATDYDWRKCEAKLNALPQFITEIDGLDIHFIHVRSKHENALPLIVTHGWPGSIIEQMKIIDPLTNPTAHGGSASDAFHLVIPSMPGYGFSGKPTTTGWDSAHIARAWVVLMKRLGYTKFVAQGGDWGAVITESDGRAGASGIARHSHQHAWRGSSRHRQGGVLRCAGASRSLGRRETRVRAAAVRLQQRASATATRWGCARRRCTELRIHPSAWRPISSTTTRCSYALIARVFDGAAEGLTRDDILDNITLTWLTNTAISGGPSLLGEQASAYFSVKGVSIPVAVSVFPDEIYPAPAELGGAGVSQTHPLQQARQRRALRGLGTAATLFRRGSRGLQIAAHIVDSTRQRYLLAGNLDAIVERAKSHWNFALREQVSRSAACD